MYRLWIEERESAVWHDALERLTPRQYRTACGWTVMVGDTRIWPQNAHEVGPPERDLCHACLAARPQQ